MKRSEVNRELLSPMMKQYMDIKDQHIDELLFYRLGDFYELFFEDAEIVSRELELTLTGKNAGLSERVPMCGVPFHAVKPYLEKIINKGYKVAIVEQMEDAKNAKGMVKREVVNVVSKGTLVDLEFLNEHDNNFIGSLLDFKYCFVLAYVDVSTGDLYIESIPHINENIINEILYLNLKELIVNDDFDIEIRNLLKNNYNIGITISNEYLENGYENLLDKLEDIKYQEAIKYLLHYLVVKQLKDLSHISEVKIVNRNNYLQMDIHTVRNLELVETLRQKERIHSLIWLIDKTKTAMGSRLLKNWLLNPLRSVEEINKRYDCIEKLNTEFILKEKLRNELYEIYDLERLCSKTICGNLNARDLLQIRNSLRVLPSIKSIVTELNFDMSISEHKDVYDLLESTIVEEPPITIKEGHMIKSGYNEELDELRSIRSGGKEFISTLESSERERTGIKNLKVGYNKIFGYFIEISKGQIKQLKDEWGFERRQTLTDKERFITPLLKEKEALVLNAEEKIIELEYNIFLSIKEEIKKHILEIKNTANIISELDALCSLATIAEEKGYVRPVLVNDSEINIVDGRHPVVESVSKNEYVPNDCIMSRDISTLLITGPNMSGKSTYMRQLGIIVIMAQMGSYVPAKSAKLPIFDKIFTRIGASDDLVSGESTFMVEMLEANHAITNATENSLILFDELGRGTATYDGMSIAESILEYINLNIKCKTLFSTHYHELTDMDKKFLSIKNVHVSAIEENNNIIFLHKVKNGSVDKSYGIHVAKLANMPEDVINRAYEILNNYENNYKKKTKSTNEQLTFVLEEKNNDPLKERLKEIDPLTLTPMEAINVLYELKNLENKK